jgi:NADPH-dependent ferric siderophore reductase
MLFNLAARARSGRRSPEPASIADARLITPGVRRLVLGGDAVRSILASTTIEPTAWLKVFAPERDGRAYTIRSVDRAAATLDIDIVLHGDGHDDGSVAAWARHARAGDDVHIGGLRNGSFALFPDTRWIWIGADDSALPAAQTILERLPAHVTAYANLHVADARERRPIDTRAELHETWRFRSESPLRPAHGIPASMQQLPGQVWIAGESTWAKSEYAHLQTTCRIDDARTSVKGYWKAGERNHRDHGRH